MAKFLPFCKSDHIFNTPVDAIMIATMYVHTCIKHPGISIPLSWLLQEGVLLWNLWNCMTWNGAEKVTIIKPNYSIWDWSISIEGKWIRFQADHFYSNKSNCTVVDSPHSCEQNFLYYRLVISYNMESCWFIFTDSIKDL